ncbi:MAG: rhomboid family intramembrane serine protease [Deltaproteobacteria bacterium]|nr:rhomboid family intramembrane serine protease [Deltaproteobacteria bacterium]
MKIKYNAPVILTLTLLSTVLLAVDQMAGDLISNFFTVMGSMNTSDPLDYARLFSHVLGHFDWTHLMGNFSFILLIGPILEEKYGSTAILMMILVTALVTALLNIFFFPTGLMGASGIVFMLILLSSFTNIRSGEIPLTFILIVVLFLAKEIINAFMLDNISQFAHIIGGVCGSIFGVLLTKEKT